MPCNHQQVEAHLCDYLDGALDPALNREIEHCIETCEECREVYESALQVRQWSHQWQPQPVPDWHRTEYAIPKRKTAFEWMPWLSMATSALAILMVVFKVEIVSTQQGVTISFGGQASQVQLAQHIDQKINELAIKQLGYIDNRFEEQQLAQATVTKGMLQELLEHSRQERRQDMQTLMASWLKQRESDNAEMNKRVDYILDNQIENNQYLNRVLQVSNTNHL
ncbi:anti-sigma factor [Pleionea sp. CnH1-48]|uniref:anti-sigma factor family protein n=1 Tax=Pleionea sp. CnH1-48 TaxID=2954494 RepID=UPI002096F1F4|nr:zf-HC2 domain-containing protein [Pleionea sp. CnH1-48]MCO7226779.1 zf-HC2 domain-containing protein [Pleionea sp. CnH1-48]